LCIGEYLERDRLVEPELGAAVQPDEMLTQHGEVHGQHVAGLAAWIVTRRLVYRNDAAVREGRGIERCGFLGVLVEPQAGCDIDLVGHGPSSFPRICAKAQRCNARPMAMAVRENIELDGLRMAVIVHHDPTSSKLF